MQKRFGQEYDSERNEQNENQAAATAVETTRSITSLPLAPSRDAKSDEEKVSMFWRVFGGTLLSIVALVCITLYNNLQGSIADLRAELSHEREARAALAKKDDIDARIKTLYERLRTFEAYKAEIETLKERSTESATEAEGARKDLTVSLDAIKKDLSGLEVVKERIALLETVKKDFAGLDALKERLTMVNADMKTIREELQKASQEVEKNKAGDLERKAFRDSQAKQWDETIKELQKGVQACREKIARLEGPQTPEKKKSGEMR